jgi:hypothetical protein
MMALHGKGASREGNEEKDKEKSHKEKVNLIPLRIHRGGFCFGGNRETGSARAFDFANVRLPGFTWR